MRGTSVILCILAIVGGSAGRGDDPPPKKLIEFGWDEPDTAFMRKHIRAMENRPFAGCVFDVVVHDPDGPKRFDQLNWGVRRFTLKELEPAIEDLKATQFHTLTDCRIVSVSPSWSGMKTQVQSPRV